MLEYLVASGLILALLSGWLLVQHLARDFSRRHPEFGPHREEGGGCGGNCACSGGGSCRRR
ncbi:MAG TPA: chemotaxis protein [Sedimenticola sp.]|nr:chemotaxis protein [Sedimenticola sp.]